VIEKVKLPKHLCSPMRESTNVTWYAVECCSAYGEACPAKTAQTMQAVMWKKSTQGFVDKTKI